MREWVQKELGYDGLSRYPDSETAMRDLVQWHQQRDQYEQLARIGTEALYRQQQQQKQAQQQAQQAQPSAPARPFWQSPVAKDEAKRLFEQWFVEDPVTRQLVPKPLAPPSAVEKVQQYVEHRKQLEDRLFDDTDNTFDEILDAKFKARFDQHSQAQQRQAESQNIIFRHSEKMFIRNPQTGQFTNQLTPWGMRFNAYVNQAAQAGVRDNTVIENIALSMIQRDEFAAHFAAQQQRTGQAPPVVPGVGAARNVQSADPEVGDGPHGLRNALRQAFAMNPYAPEDN